MSIFIFIFFSSDKKLFVHPLHSPLLLKMAPTSTATGQVITQSTGRLKRDRQSLKGLIRHLAIMSPISVNRLIGPKYWPWHVGSAWKQRVWHSSAGRKLGHTWKHRIYSRHQGLIRRVSQSLVSEHIPRSWCKRGPPYELLT